MENKYDLGIVYVYNKNTFLSKTKHLSHFSQVIYLKKKTHSNECSKRFLSMTEAGDDNSYRENMKYKYTHQAKRFSVLTDKTNSV